MKIYRIPMVPGPVSVSREVLEAGQENFGSADLEKEYIDLYKATGALECFEELFVTGG